MPTEEEVEAGAAVIAASPSIDAPKLPALGWMGLAREILTAAECVRVEQYRKICKHLRASGIGTMNSDGSGYSNWSCPDCGAHHSYTSPPRTNTANPFGGMR